MVAVNCRVWLGLAKSTLVMIRKTWWFCLKRILQILQTPRQTVCCSTRLDMLQDFWVWTYPWWVPQTCKKQEEGKKVRLEQWINKTECGIVLFSSLQASLIHSPRSLWTVQDNATLQTLWGTHLTPSGINTTTCESQTLLTQPRLTSVFKGKNLIPFRVLWIPPTYLKTVWGYALAVRMLHNFYAFLYLTSLTEHTETFQAEPLTGPEQ